MAHRRAGMQHVHNCMHAQLAHLHVGDDVACRILLHAAVHVPLTLRIHRPHHRRILLTRARAMAGTPSRRSRAACCLWPKSRQIRAHDHQALALQLRQHADAGRRTADRLRAHPLGPRQVGGCRRSCGSGGCSRGCSGRRQAARHAPVNTAQLGVDGVTQLHRSEKGQQVVPPVSVVAWNRWHDLKRSVMAAQALRAI